MRLFELRTYVAAPGRFTELDQRFREHTVGLFERHGIELIGAWRRADNAGDDTLVYLVAFPSEEAAETAWEAFRSDPEWIRVRDDSERNGTLTQRIERVFLDALRWSPLA